MLVLGRSSFIDPGAQLRLDWRSKNCPIGTIRVICLTFDQLYDKLATKVRIYTKLGKAIGGSAPRKEVTVRRVE